MDKAVGTPELRKGPCLLVEDDPVLRRILRTHLVRSGFEVLVASSVAEATEQLASQPVSYLVSDALLPDGSVLELLAKLATLRVSPAVVVMSGDKAVAGAVEAVRQGATDFLLKPFSMHALDAALARADTLSGLHLIEPATKPERGAPDAHEASSAMRRSKAP